MEKDVVCGMQVDPAKAAGSSEFNGKTYHFCSKGCKTSSTRIPGNSSSSDPLSGRRSGAGAGNAAQGVMRMPGLR